MQMLGKKHATTVANTIKQAAKEEPNHVSSVYCWDAGHNFYAVHAEYKNGRTRYRTDAEFISRDKAIKLIGRANRYTWSWGRCDE